MKLSGAIKRLRALAESELLGKLRLALGCVPGVLLLRINTGVFRPIHGAQDRRIRSAPNGTPDLLGIAYAVPLAIETKSARGPQRKAQEDFETAWIKVGGIYILARDLDRTVAAVLGLRDAEKK